MGGGYTGRREGDISCCFQGSPKNTKTGLGAVNGGDNPTEGGWVLKEMWENNLNPHGNLTLRGRTISKGTRIETNTEESGRMTNAPTKSPFETKGGGLRSSIADWYDWLHLALQEKGTKVKRGLRDCMTSTTPGMKNGGKQGRLAWRDLHSIRASVPKERSRIHTLF